MYDLQRLEYQKVLSILSGFCASVCTRSSVMELRPFTDKQKAVAELELVSELVRARESGLELPHEPVGETRDAVRRARVRGSMLEPADLCAVRSNVRAYQTLRAGLKQHKDEIPGVWATVLESPPPGGLVKRIDGVLDRNGKVRDDASPAMRDITGRIRAARAGIEEIMEGYFRSPDMKGVFRQKQVTMKDDRYVVPLKQNFKGRIPGVVHAHSGTERTVFVEPADIVEHNNQLRLLYREREEETRRLLKELTSEVRQAADEILSVQERLVSYELLLAKISFMDRYQCCIPGFTDKPETLVRAGRHPLIRGETVPVDFHLKAPAKAMVITGPNTGGKTVTLKMAGLLALMAQSGIPVPAKEFYSHFFTSVYADIGDEGSIEQNLSTFSAHVKNIRRMVEQADSESLVLIDELGAGTDPLEGGPLGAAILEWLIGAGITTIVTTHFSFIKMFALEHRQVEVASMEFDPGSCLPTYRLVSGIPGRSNALEIARHLGLREEILQRTTGYLSEEDRSTDLVLKRLARMERELAGREVQVTAHRNTLESMVAEYRQRLEDLRERQRYHKSHLQGEMAQLLAEYRKKLENSIREVRESQAEQEKIEQARSGLAELDQEFQQFVNEVVAPEEKMPEEISEGGGIAGVDVDGRTYAGGDRAAARSDRADIRGAGRGDCAITKGDLVEFDQAGVRTRGVVTGIEGKTAAIRAGSFRVKVGLDQVRFVGTPGERSGHTSSGPAAGSWEVSREIAGSASLDLRGQRYDDAVQELAGFMDRAVLDNRETVYIIHGMGTGALRQGVWDYLKTFPHADTWEYAHPDQGGYGCTIVTLK